MKMTPVNVPKSQRKKFRELFKAIADILIHFTMEELETLHDFIEQEKWRE